MIKMLGLYFILLIVIVLIAGCASSAVYEGVAKPLYKGVKSKLNKLDARIVELDSIRTNMKGGLKSDQVILRCVIVDGL